MKLCPATSAPGWRLLLASLTVVSQLSAANPPSPGALSQGQALAAELRSEKPTEDLEVKGLIRIRDNDGRRTSVPFRYRIIAGTTTWQTLYEAQGTQGRPAERLVVVHADDQPNRYFLSRTDPGQAPPADVPPLTGDQAMVPFAASDFWLADLGLEFLHWPEHRIVEEARIRMRKGRPCQVLESTNPRPGAAGYTRVRSWVDTKTHKPILAETYGPDGRLWKEFEVGSVTKVGGVWELKNLEMRNAKTDSQTVLEFKYERRE